MEEFKQYKVNRKLITFTCFTCRKQATKPITEYNRNIKLGRKNFCSRSCASIYASKIRTNDWSRSDENKENLKLIYCNREDEYTPFRYTLRNAKKRFKDFNLDLVYLKELWELQNGICPYTKIKLILPKNNHRVDDLRIRASLDRIDSSKGYIKGNVQYISTAINFMKHTLSHKQTIDFLQTITSNLSFDKDQTISSSQKEMSDAQAGN